jgi:hypothetical protein
MSIKTTKREESLKKIREFNATIIFGIQNITKSFSIYILKFTLKSQNDRVCLIFCWIVGA